MLVRYTFIMNGPGPSESIIHVDTVEGREEIIVDRTILKSGVIDVGAAITSRNETYLIELPREASSGRMRVWVGEANVVHDTIAA